MFGLILLVALTPAWFFEGQFNNCIIGKSQFFLLSVHATTLIIQGVSVGRIRQFRQVWSILGRFRLVFSAMCMKCEAFYRKPHIVSVSKTHHVSPTGSTAYCLNYRHEKEQDTCGTPCSWAPLMMTSM